MKGAEAAMDAERPTADAVDPYLYHWPRPDSFAAPAWKRAALSGWRTRAMPETEDELRRDSRWPALFPQPICIVTTASGGVAALEKVVGATIVNRFPYTLALSFCVTGLSGRHHPRNVFLETLAAGDGAAVQFLPPGPALDRVMETIAAVGEEATCARIAATGLKTAPGLTVSAPVFDEAYLVYEARLIAPGRDIFGQTIFAAPHLDIGSHRVAFLEIAAIQLDQDIAAGRRRIRWRSLPRWTPQRAPTDAAAPATLTPTAADARQRILDDLGYRKSYRADYAFPAADTAAFEADGVLGRRAFKRLPPDPSAQVEVDNDRARWPCFFPSPVGMISTWDDDGRPNLMPCGSTTVVSRQPLVIAPCISYSPINARYAPRATLDYIRRRGRFGCGVAFDAPGVLDAIAYLGNVSSRRDADKLTHAGLELADLGETPCASLFPIHYDCRVVGEVALGTHVMVLGEVERIFARDDLETTAPLVWRPWADVEAAG